MAKKSRPGARPASPHPPDPRAAALAELDQLLWSHERREVDDWQVAPRLREVAGIVGTRLFDELVNHVWGPDEQIRSSVVWALGVLAGREAVPKLWEIVRTSHRSTRARLGALEALHRMGGVVQPGQVPEDLLEKIGIAGRAELRNALAALGEAQTPAAVEEALLPILRLPYGSTDEEREKGLDTSVHHLYQVADRADRAAANFLSALAATTPVPDLKAEAERTLTILRSRGIAPASPAVLALHGQRFYKAYVRSVPGKPGQTETIVAWQRGEDAIMAFIFTADVEELHGGIQALEVTGDFSPAQFAKRFVEGGWLAGTPPREVTFEEARQRVAEAIQANLRGSVPLPDEFYQYQPLIDRYLEPVIRTA